MNKKLLLVLVMVLTIVSTSLPALAAPHNSYSSSTNDLQQPIIFQNTFTVTAEGGSFEIGFVTMKFKKNFLPAEKLPATFIVKVYAKSGDVRLDITPDTDEFDKNVHVKVDEYKGYIYDEDLGKNIFVNVKDQKLVLKHFSWYRLR